MRMLPLALAGMLALARPAVADTIGIITDPLDADARFGMDLTAIEAPGHRVLWIGGAGSLQNLLDILRTRGVDAGLMLTDTLDYAKQHHVAPPAELAHIQYIAKLWQEEVHVLAGPPIKALPDLDGKKVNVDVVGSSSWMTADIIFRILGMHPAIETMPQDEALIAVGWFIADWWRPRTDIAGMTCRDQDAGRVLPSGSRHRRPPNADTSRQRDGCFALCGVSMSCPSGRLTGGQTDFIRVGTGTVMSAKACAVSSTRHQAADTAQSRSLVKADRAGAPPEGRAPGVI